ncbi:DUF3160 domain-containing protein [Saccharicrinis sp. FJH54]|uniref:DUF3160 domain-containing protein n=1 Tax=Saccharicrinis sp. FJH54 TaxID=3344665 RepID=UPI0035D51893
MKSIFTLLASLLLSGILSAQVFDPYTYHAYREQHKNLSKEALFELYPQNGEFYSSDIGPFDIATSCYFDSVVQKFNLTGSELELLKKNHFVVTERLSYNSVLAGLDQVYHNDLPVFITSDVLLHALHNSYDNMLQDMEINYLEPKLKEALRKMYEQFLSDAPAYNADPELKHTVGDAELYILMARVLLDSNLVVTPTYCSENEFHIIKRYIFEAGFKSTPLFTYNSRNIDFSQFIPRGHYTDGQEDYFRSMMWLSFINIFLTLPPQDFTMDSTDVQRMALLSAMVNEVLYKSGADEQLNEIDDIIKYFVGESDNLTPLEFKNVMDELSITSVSDLADDATLKSLQQKLLSEEQYGQKILSDIIMTNPFTSETAKLPVSYKLFGQRFVIDSYVLHNVTYDRIVYNNQKVLRMMPDPLDVSFCLGNNNAIHLLGSNLDKYPYGSAIDAMRYLFDAYDDTYWSESLYNIWLKSIKDLSVAENNDYTPFFMKTVAWQHEKLNSQLASWSQLRHDNILYAKQSYTGGITCSYPYGYIEPYPAFYLSLKQFAYDAALFLSADRLGTDKYETFWTGFATVADELLNISLKEVNGEAFSEEQVQFLQQALRVVQYGVCGEPPTYDGWMLNLFWNVDEASQEDFTVADVHTQPTDELGNMVGKVLHTGVGRFNMGVFIAPAPANEYKPTLFCGPVISYYQFITDNFVRKNDNEWSDMIWRSQAPERPGWTNIYLADSEGKTKASTMELKGTQFTDTAYTVGGTSGFNPSNEVKPVVWINGSNLHITGFNNNTNTSVSLFDTGGRLVFKTVTDKGIISTDGFNRSVLFYRITNNNKTYSGKIIPVSN